MGHVVEDPAGGFLKIHVEPVLENVWGVFPVGLDVVRGTILDHQPTHVRPEKTHEWAVRIRLVIGVAVVKAMHGDPFAGSVLHATQGHDDEPVLEPLGKPCGFVSQDSVVAEVDRLTEDMNSEDHHDKTRPTEEPGQKRRQCEQMNEDDWNGIGPSNLTSDDGVRKRKMGAID